MGRKGKTVREVDIDEAAALIREFKDAFHDTPLPAEEPSDSFQNKWKLWICDKCGDHSECEPGTACEVCEGDGDSNPGTIRIVEVVPASLLTALQAENRRLRQNEYEWSAKIIDAEQAESRVTSLTAALEPFAALPVDEEEPADYAILSEAHKPLFYKSDLLRAHSALADSSEERE